MQSLLHNRLYDHHQGFWTVRDLLRTGVLGAGQTFVGGVMVVVCQLLPLGVVEAQTNGRPSEAPRPWQTMAGLFVIDRAGFGLGGCLPTSRPVPPGAMWLL